MTETLVQILISPKLEDTLIDWLLARPQALVFETSRVQQYGHPLDSLAERVTGFRQQVLFTLPIAASVLDDFLYAFRQAFANHLDTGTVSCRALPLTASKPGWQAV